MKKNYATYSTLRGPTQHHDRCTNVGMLPITSIINNTVMRCKYIEQNIISANSIKVHLTTHPPPHTRTPLHHRVAQADVTAYPVELASVCVCVLVWKIARFFTALLEYFSLLLHLMTCVCSPPLPRATYGHTSGGNVADLEENVVFRLINQEIEPGITAVAKQSRICIPEDASRHSLVHVWFSSLFNGNAVLFSHVLFHYYKYIQQ